VTGSCWDGNAGIPTVKGYIGSTFTDDFAEQMPEYKAHVYKHDAGKITTLLDTHVADVDARKALGNDLIDLLSHCKPKETQTQLDIKAHARSEFKTYLFLRSVSKSQAWLTPNYLTDPVFPGQGTAPQCYPQGHGYP